MTARADPTWVQTELIPFLNTVFRPKSAAEWQFDIRHAEMNLYNIVRRTTLRRVVPTHCTKL